MAKGIPDAVMDLDLDYIKDTANCMVLCTEEPTSYAEAKVAHCLATQAMVAGDFTLADLAPNGRKLTVAAKAGIEVTTTGTGNHVVLLDTVLEEILVINTCGNCSVTDDGTVDIASWVINKPDPT